MWLLNFLPNIVFHIALVLGVLGIVVSIVLTFLPGVAKYHIPVLLLSVLLTVVAVWYEGGISKDIEYQLAMQALQLKVAESEKKAAEANAKIEYIFIDRIQRVKDVQVVVQEKIRNVSVKIDEHCKITSDVIDIHNSAARNIK